MKRRGKKSAQEIQDAIFKKMSADEKIAFSSQLWQLAKDLAGKNWAKILGCRGVLDKL